MGRSRSAARIRRAPTSASPGSWRPRVAPPPEAMARLGHKGNARRLAQRCGIPVVPGYDGGEETREAFLEAARRLGYPLLVKAAAGGGGRGMRLVAEERD